MDRALPVISTSTFNRSFRPAAYPYPGFFLGRSDAMLCATNPYDSLFSGGRLRFAAHLANYPVCWVCNRVPGAAQRFISHKIYAQATHAWDRLEPAITVTDPFSHLGQGGQVDFVPNPEAASRSRPAAVLSFEQAFSQETRRDEQPNRE